MQAKCNEIESRMYEQDISIQVEWKPWVVEFYISGLEEGVTNTLHCIQHEFQVTTYILLFTYLENEYYLMQASSIASSSSDRLSQSCTSTAINKEDTTRT